MCVKIKINLCCMHVLMILVLNDTSNNDNFDLESVYLDVNNGNVEELLSVNKLESNLLLLIN